MTASAPAAVAVAGSTTFDVTLTNTGAAAPVNTPSPHPSNPAAAPYLTSDIYRLSISVDRPGWSASLQSALVAVKTGESIAVPVRVARPSTARAPATVTLVAVSESDPAKTATASTLVSGTGPQQRMVNGQ